MQLEAPFILLGLVLLVPYLLWALLRSYADLPPIRRWLVLAVRLVALTFVLFALARPVLLLTNRDRAVLFLLDVSDSVPAATLDSAWSAITDATADLDGGCSAGLILFAGRPALAAAPADAPLELTGELRRRVFHVRERDLIDARLAELERSELDDARRAEIDRLRGEKAELEGWRDDIDVDETNLEAACRLARGVLPRETRRRLVLLSDGNQTRGEVLRELGPLRDDRFSVHTVLLERGEEPEVIAESITLPAEAQVQAPFDLEIAVSASHATSAEVSVYRNRFLLTTKTIDLEPGRNILDIPRVRLDEGFHEFEALVRAGEDTVLENNVARAAVRVTGRPRVLLVERDPLEGRYLEEALGAEEIQVEVRPPTGIPEDLNDLLNYDVLVLSDVPATAMSPAQMDLVKRYVREMGGGLVMLGGEHSFGLGGYYRTPVEDALPVRMPIRKNVEKPNLAIVLVIDKSGSMTGQKIELAKEAAIASAEVLKPRDQIGVVAFDSLSEWICTMTEASELDVITQMVSRLIAGGGTNIYPGLYDAYQALLQSDARLKHIILLSDGMTQGGGYDQLVSHIPADDITLSTVGIGDGADANLLRNMATWGGGEYYFTSDFGAVPQIFTRETLRASKSMLVEEPFLPVLTERVDALKGIDMDSMPFLLGYVATTPRPTATVALVSEYGDPILATWRYGLGRAAAFTSDARAGWAGDWIGWEGFSKLWGQLVRSVMSTGTHRDLRTASRVVMQDGAARLTLDVRGRAGQFRDDVEPEVSIVRGRGEPEPLEVAHVAPGLFQSRFPLEAYGEFHRLIVMQKQDGAVVDVKALAVTESYSPEFRDPRPDRELLELIAARTGGRAGPDPAAIWAFEDTPARMPRETWWWWLAAAALLLPLDIALRRLG